MNINYKLSLTSLTIIAFLLFSACKKEKPIVIDPETLAPLTIEFDNIVGEQNLILQTAFYHTNGGERYTVNSLQYYISNVQVGTQDGKWYTVPQEECYFLIDEGNMESTMPKLKVPEGDYTQLKFLIGIDSVRSTMDVSERTGVLDPSNEAGMYWGWNGGYIFFKLEGSLPSGVEVRDYAFHIGGFGGYDLPTINNIKEVNIDLSQQGAAKVRVGGNSTIHLLVDIAKVFDNKENIDIESMPSIMFSGKSTVIADNYADMFTHDHTHN